MMVKKRGLGAALHLMYGLQGCHDPSFGEVGHQLEMDSAYLTLKEIEPMNRSRLKVSES